MTAPDTTVNVCWLIVTKAVEDPVGIATYDPPIYTEEDSTWTGTPLTRFTVVEAAPYDVTTPTVVNGELIAELMMLPMPVPLDVEAAAWPLFPDPAGWLLPAGGGGALPVGLLPLVGATFPPVDLLVSPVFGFPAPRLAAEFLFDVVFAGTLAGEPDPSVGGGKTICSTLVVARP